MNPYLKTTDIINTQTPDIQNLAKQIASGKKYQAEIAEACFKWVRDNIKHSWDYGFEKIVYTASDVLAEGHSTCFGKSHLLTALLRCHEIPAGFCYQRLSIDEVGPPFTLHGLNAVLLPATGWYRLDARGNKPGVNARFSPPTEALPFIPQIPGEADLPEIWPEPLPIIIDALETYPSVSELWDNLPDIELITLPSVRSIEKRE